MRMGNPTFRIPTSRFCWQLIALLLCAGCTAHSLPPIHMYPPMDSASALTILAQRAAAIHSVTATCELKLIRHDGQNVHLDAQVVMQTPNHFRMRAYKFTQAVFDLTVRPDGVWVESDADSAHAAQAAAMSHKTAEIGRMLTWFSGAFFIDPGIHQEIASSTSSPFQFDRPMDGGGKIVCAVSRDTITPLSYTIFDDHGDARFELLMQDYHEYGGLAWPTKVTAQVLTPDSSTDAAGDQIIVEFSDVQLNSPVPPRAFTPPLHAVKQP